MNDFQYTRGETILKVSNLSVTYDLPILRNINLDISDLHRPGLQQGQVLAILAPSGMGKTQLFKRLAGLLPPSSGQILIGEKLEAVKPGMVGVVPQDYRLFRHRTVEASLMIAAKMREHGTQKARDKVLEIITDFGLQDKLKSYPCELSGGQRQRVSIAEQLLSSNHFLIMDEPFSGLDIIAKKKVCDTVSTVAARDELNTIIFSTHDIDAAVMVADTIVVLGRERDQNGAPIPGATVKGTIDLIERNLAWHKDVDQLPAFAQTVAEIKAAFPLL